MSAGSPRRRRPIAAAALVTVGLVLMGGLYAAASSLASPARAGTNEASPELISQGAQLYKEGCSSCHGLNLEGVPADSANKANPKVNGPTLIGVGAAAVDFQVSTGRMPVGAYGKQVVAGRSSYTEEETSALAAYVASFAPGPAIPSKEDLDTTDASLAEGGELFRTNCSQCHNFAAQGGALSDGTFAPSIDPSQPNHIWEAMLTGPQNMPVFNDTTVNPDEKRAIIKYIASIKAESNPGGAPLGRVGPVSEGLLLWTLGLGALIACSVWLGAKAK
ncbi:unannotated protein [freshwater metagenome]|uniref:Cytochrome bc1 complex cytochrome c subunit n=1 Tax=freshwater metagenome TaxID=449393 RepID=A0A6J7DNL7_9ZZZZ|nr:c-type cytochrome [Actinomycetota bacterium]